MVDSIDLLLAEVAADLVIDLARGRKVLAERLLQHHAAGGGDEPGLVQMAADRGEQRRSGGEVIHLASAGHVAEPLAQGGEAGGIARIERDIVNACREGSPACGVEVPLQETLALLGGKRAVAGGVQRLAGDADDRDFGAEHVGTVQVVERGQQLAHHQVARAAEENDVLASVL